METPGSVPGTHFNGQRTLNLLFVLKLRHPWPFAAVLVTAAFFMLNALWIPVKAEFAQYLLEDAWQRTLNGENTAKPWPWADTSPAGLLEVPGKGIRQIVLSGTSGRNLAFGPTFLGSPMESDRVISGHRDTHFEFLQHLEPGDRVTLTTTDSSREYEVAWIEIVDSDSQQMVMNHTLSRLTLTTCYPFDVVSTGGPLRYVVTALPVSAPG